MRISNHNILQFAVDNTGWRGRFDNVKGDTWEVPIIGWAVTPTWTSWDDPEPRVIDEIETDLTPVFLEDGVTYTRAEYISNHQDCRLVTIVR